jgi:hypothetical protein
MQTTQDGRHAFDFLIGDWQVHNRRLRERLADCMEWEVFDGHSIVRPILNGLGNFDEITMNRESGIFHGVTLRLFDVATEQWRIYWADGSRGEVDLPMIGGFQEGCGTFYAQEFFQERAVFSRFIWIVHSIESCHWEQALSTDGGQTWETNWTMDFTRLASSSL